MKNLRKTEQYLEHEWNNIAKGNEPQQDTLELFFVHKRYDLIADYLFGAGALEKSAIEYWNEKDAEEIWKGLVFLAELPRYNEALLFITEINPFFTSCPHCNSLLFSEENFEEETRCTNCAESFQTNAKRFNRG
jgi:hypothetical protein